MWGGRPSEGAPVWAKMLGLVAGLLVSLMGLILAGVAFLLIGLKGDDSVFLGVLLVGLVSISLPLGLLLAYHSMQAIQNRPSGPFRAPRLRWIALLFGLALAGGWGTSHLVRGTFASLALLPFHLLAAGLPSLGVISLVQGPASSQDGSLLSWRLATLQTAYGVLLAPLGAMALEFILIATLAILGVAGLAITQGGVRGLEGLSQGLGRLSSSPAAQDPAWVFSFVARYRLFFIPIAMGILLVPPVVEEALKPLGVAALGYQRPSPVQAFMWGVISGTAFAAMENVLFLYALSGPGWPANMAMRVGGTCIHSLGTGLVGAGWSYRIREGRILPLGVGFLVAIILHGMWNLVSFAAGGLTLLQTALKGDQAFQFLASVLGLIFVVLLVGFVAVAFFGLYYLPRSLRQRSGFSVTSSSE